MDTVHECDRQTDGQTDGRTDRITITDTVQTASHGKKVINMRCVANMGCMFRVYGETKPLNGLTRNFF